MNQKFVREEFDLYVWEGTSDIAARAERCLAGMDVTLVRADAGTAFPPPRDPGRPAVALVSVSVMGDNRFSGYDWLAVQALPIIWVASEARGRDPRYYPPEYSYTLPLAFTTADLRKLLFELLGVLDQARPAAPRREQPLIAVSEPMRALLAEAEMYADCRSNVLVHGETGVGKERVARLLRPRGLGRRPLSRSIAAPFPKDCSRRISSATPGAFTGAVGALGLFRAGQWRHAVPGRDRRPAAVPAGQAVAGAGAEHGHAPGLGDRSAGGFPAGRRHQQDLRVLVAQDEFRADLYYRLAVIRMRIPSLEQRGAAERSRCSAPAGADGRRGRAAGLAAGTRRGYPLRGQCARAVQRGRARGNRPAPVPVLGPGAHRAHFRPAGRAAAPARRDGRGRRAVRPPVFTDAERAERARILAALDANGWRRQDTANTLGISRKVLWEKMRKLHLGGGQGETADGMVEAS